MDKRPNLEAFMSEREVCEATGINEESIRPVRVAKLERDVDWFRDNRKMVQYTKNGLRRLQEALGGIEIAGTGEIVAGNGTESTPCAQKEAPPPALPVMWQELDIRVERVCPNPTWVQGRIPDGRLVNIRVRDNGRMTRGTLLEACKLHGTVWVYGGKCR